ncbi:BPSL0067 family protein [Burkholderia sola]|uniref:BPSL0067 family protein n=1 Tax=Burkholderia sola TaxID=2843302 RepID=UPI001C0A8D81
MATEKKAGGDRSIRVGTVIATFENDRYPSRSRRRAKLAMYAAEVIRVQAGAQP